MPQFRIGTDDFKKLRDENGYFVDKSLLIKEIIEGSDVTLLPRPRRFGKTLNMTMLRYFFEKNETSNAYLFEGLEIIKYPQYMECQGQYPVIFISLKDFKRSSYESFLAAVRTEMSRLFSSFSVLISSLDNGKKDRFLRICREQADVDDLYGSLKELILNCYQYYQKPVVVIIDEYDAPMIEAWTNGYYEEISQFMRFWLGGGLKHDNASSLYRAVITGILRIAKESIFSELNNLKICTTLLPNTLAHQFGFTEEEVEKILIDFHLIDQAKTVREWYNGYSFGTKTIYNPWSVSNYIDNFPAPPGPHWLNTSSNALIYEELNGGGLEIKKDLERLLSGEELRYPINETITFRDIGKSPVNIWSFLYYSGYLNADTPEWAEYDETLLTYSLKIPNQEIAVAYRQFVNYTLEDGVQPGVKQFISVFLEDKPSIVLEQVLQELTLTLVSMYDLAKLPEAVFHAFVLGLLANLRIVYEIKSNTESGYGRADILMIPKTSRYQTGYIIEFKSIGLEENIEEACTRALTQIHKNVYHAAVHNAGIPPQQVRSLAIILQGKRIFVREKIPDKP